MKKRINMQEKLRQIANDYLNDRSFSEYQKFNNTFVDEFLNMNLQPKPNLLEADDFFSSVTETERLKKSKYFVSFFNTRIEKSKEMDSYLKDYTRNLLKSQGDLLKRIDSEIESLEVKYFEQSDIVHVNNFSKEMDKIDYTKNSVFRKDFRTNLNFQKKDLMQGLFGSGLTLPVDRKEVANVDMCIVLDEETNVGDTRKKIFENENPNNIFRKGKIFRYAIVKSTSDTSSRFYKRKTSFLEYPYSLAPTLTLEVNLETYSGINYIKIDPVSVEGFFLKSIQIKDGKDLVSLEFEIKLIDNKYYVFFERIFSEKIKFKFEQRACIENAKVIVSNKKSFYLNESMQKNNFVSRVAEDYEEITGNVYDLSIKDIEIGFLSFKSYGFLQSKPIEVFDFLSSRTSISYASFSENIYIESYLGLSLVDKDGNLQVEELLPVPDSKSFQEENLFFTPTNARCKLYPDVLEGACEIQLSIEESDFVQTSFGWTIYEIDIDECFDPEIHSTGILTNVVEEGFVVNYDKNTVGYIYKKEPNGKWLIALFKADYDYLNYDVATFTEAINQNLIFTYGRNSFFLEVYENGNLLLPKADYEYSLDNGVSWYGDIVDSEFYIEEIQNKRAGHFLIRLVNGKKEKSIYTVKYKIDPEQTLSKKKNVFLINEKIKLHESLFPNYGYCQNVIVAKNIYGNSDEIFILEKYRNVIFQNGKKENTNVIKKQFGSKLKGNDV